MFTHVARAEYQAGYRIWIEFEDGQSGIIDLEHELDGPVFAPLRDVRVFRSFKVDAVAKTLVWPNGADFAPEFLKGKLLRQYAEAD